MDGPSCDKVASELQFAFNWRSIGIDDAVHLNSRVISYAEMEGPETSIKISHPCNIFRSLAVSRCHFYDSVLNIHDDDSPMPFQLLQGSMLV